MSQTATDVGNQALVHLGAAPPFMTDIATDATKAGLLLRQSLDLARRYVLCQHAWNFAVKRDTLAVAVVTGTANGTGNKVRLTLSAVHNFVTGDKVTVTSVQGTTEANGDWIITVVDTTHIELDGTTWANAWTSGGYVGLYCSFDFNWGVRAPTALLRIWSVDDDPSTDYEFAEGILWMNDTSHNVKYIQEVTDYAKMSVTFYQTLALYLAWMVAFPLTDSTKTGDAMWEMYEKAIKKARFIDSTENPRQRLEDRTLMDARYTTGYLADPKRYK